MNSTGISTMKPVYPVYCEVSTCVYENFVVMKIQKYKLFAWSVVQENEIHNQNYSWAIKLLNLNVAVYG
jgi:hypothetical protein